MAEKEKKVRKPLSRRAKIIIPIVIVVGLVILIIGGFTVGTSLENNNAFCGSCHTQPEVTFLQQSTQDPPVNLASFHISQKSVKCIDCHSGQGVIGRAAGLAQGGINAVKFYTGTANQPGKLYGNLPVANCMKCHASYIAQASSQGGPTSGHWHFYLSQWEKIDTSAAVCASCHTGHKTDGDPTFSYLNRGDILNVCESCHAKLRPFQGD